MRSALRSSQIVLRMTQQKRLNKRLSTNDSTQTTQRRRLNADQSTQTIKSSHQKAKFQLRVRPCWFLGKRACPRAYGAKRVRVRIREKEGFKHRWFWRAPCFWGAKNVETARWVKLSSPRFESVFFASFLCRFGQRNDVPPRTVANSDEEKSQLRQT